MVAIAILAIILVVLTEIAGETSLTIQKTSRSMETSELCLAALDHIESDFSGMVTTGTATMVVVKNSVGVNDGLALISNVRVRSRTGASISVSGSSDIRMGVIGYCVANTTDADVSGSPKVPMLNWGNGTVTWLAGQAPNGQYVNSAPLNLPGSLGGSNTALSGAVADISAVVSSNGTPPPTPNMLQFQSLSKGIFRLEICFLLSDGTLVSVSAPPLNKNFLSTASPPPAVTFNPAQNIYALAFKSNDSNNATTYVRALIIGVAGIDSMTQKTLTASQLASLPNALAKTTDNQTPLQAWDISDSSKPTYTNLKAYPTQVLQNIRFFQRYFYVN